MEQGAVKPFEVVMRHSETTQSKLRDFRWLSKANEDHTCTFPNFKPEFKKKGRDLCFQPIFWQKERSQENDMTYTVTTPPPMVKDHWQGVFAEVVFPYHHPTGHFLMDLVIPPDEFSLTSPGWVTPDTFPFKDCHGEECTNTLI